MQLEQLLDVNSASPISQDENRKIGHDADEEYKNCDNVGGSELLLEGKALQEKTVVSVLLAYFP